MKKTILTTLCLLTVSTVFALERKELSVYYNTVIQSLRARDFPKAEKTVQYVLSILKEKHHKDNLLLIYDWTGLLGRVYRNQRVYQKALKTYHEQLTISKKIASQTNMEESELNIETYLNLAELCIEMDNKDQAKKYAKQTLKATEMILSLNSSHNSLDRYLPRMEMLFNTLDDKVSAQRVRQIALTLQRYR